MKTCLQTTKSIMDELFKFTETHTLDDRTEFFPLLRVVLTGAVNSDPEHQKEIHETVIEYCRDKYVKLWMKQALENTSPDEGLDLQGEINDASKHFRKMWLPLDAS